MKIFWSWQSDTPPSTGRDFVKDCLKEAINQLSDESNLDEAPRVELDHDTKGVPGLAAIADTIFEKIDAAALFVADVTFTGASSDGTKKTPNPNVLIELGYAFRALGPERIVLVANKASGFRPEDLPFDLRHRRGPITYDLPAGADKLAKAGIRKFLVRDLTEALRSNLASIAPAPAPAPLLQASIPEDRALWFSPDDTIGLHDGVLGKLSSGPARAYLRVSVAGWAGKKPVRHDIVRSKFHPFGEWRDGSSMVPNALGVIAGGWRGDVQRITALTQWFDKTTEIWGISPSYGYESDGAMYLATHALGRQWRNSLRDWVRMLDQLGARKPYRVEMGLTGAQGLLWPGERLFFERMECLDAEIFYDHTDKDWSDAAQLRFLAEVFGKICDSFSLERLSLEDVSALTSR